MTAPDAAVQIAAEELREINSMWHHDGIAQRVIAALAAAGWLHDPAEVAALRAVADAAAEYLEPLPGEATERYYALRRALDALPPTDQP